MSSDHPKSRTITLTSSVPNDGFRFWLTWEFENIRKAPTDPNRRGLLEVLNNYNEVMHLYSMTI